MVAKQPGGIQMPTYRSKEPAFGDLKLPAYALDLPPESVRMVHLPQVAEFVENDIIPNKCRRLDKPPVQRNGPTPGT